MLQFETLLLRQLQKQQNRDEFCDTVLHTQGVSVPVHSCVLSAFSPKLRGTLSSMPLFMAGQRRLIEVQAVDACTLLSLVRVLYSGQFLENRERVLSAAKTLGIEFPHWQEEERHGGNMGRRKDSHDAGQEMEKEVDARRTEEGSGREEEKKRDSSTQTDCGREMNEKGAQTDLACLEPQSIQTVYPIDQTAFSNQELGRYKDIYDASLSLQTTHPERISTTCEMLAMVPDTGDCRIVSESGWASQICLYSLETSHHQSSTSVTPHNSVLDKAMVTPAVEADTINDLNQFEGNIPGFISYFLDSIDSQNTERKGQGCASEVAKEQEVVKRAKAKPTSGGSVREWVRCVGGGRKQRHKERGGLVARLAWQGRGGGRVGRLLETRAKGKITMRAFQKQQSREAFMDKEKARGRGRGRPRKRGMTGTVAGSEGQNDSHRRRPRGRPRTQPLPPASRSFSTVTPAKQDTVDPTELTDPTDLLHTVNPTPAVRSEAIQPIDALLDDIMKGLHFLPQTENQINQHGQMSSTSSSGPPTSNDTYPNSHYIKLTDSKQHLEGEFSDILNHFLRTFDQQAGCCGFDVGDETLQDKLDAGNDKTDPSPDPGISAPKIYTQQQSHNPHLHHQKPQAKVLHTSRTTVNPSVAKKTNAQDGQVHGSEMKKLPTDQNITQQFENRRLTRSQSMKRKLETALNSLQNPVKMDCKEKQSIDTKPKRRRDERGKIEARLSKSEVNNLDKNKKNRATQALSEESQKQASTREKKDGVNRFGRKIRGVENTSDRIDVFYQRKQTPKEARPGINGCGKRKKKVGDHVDADRISNGFQDGQSSVKSQIGGSCFEIASSALEKVRMLLQLQDEEQDESANESVDLHRVNVVGNGRLIDHKSIAGADERRPVENSLRGHLGKNRKPESKRRITVNGQKRRNSTVKVSQRQEDEGRMADEPKQEELMTEQCSTPFHFNLLSNAATDFLVSRPGDPDSTTGVRSTQSTMHKTVDLTLDAGNPPRIVSATQLSYAQLCQELLSPHTSTKDLQQMAGSSVDEDDDVDVLVVSSPDSELPASSTVILEVDLSTEEEEEEEEVEDDFEIDVLGLEPD